MSQPAPLDRKNLDHTTPTDVDRDDVVELRLPARPHFLRLARLTAAGFAGDLGLDLRSIEDLRVAVDELCAAIIDGAHGAILELRYSAGEHGEVCITGSIAGEHGAAELHPVARELLRIVARDYELVTTGLGRVFTLVVSGPSVS